MADTSKVLGQVSPGSGTLTTLYTTPGATQTTTSSLTVCNRAPSATTFRVSVAVAAAADTVAQYVYYDAPLAANDTFVATIGITLATTDVVRVRSANGLVSFNLFGVEVT